MTGRTCTVLTLGAVDYGAAWELQTELARRRAEGAIGDVLLLLEHPHVYTLGRRGRPDDLLLSTEALARRNAAVYEVDRGGATTYHGPGQLVGYPILDIRRWGGGPVRYVRALEGALMETLEGFGVGAHRVEGFPGVWTGAERGDPTARSPMPDARKIAAIGVRISRGVTTHGFALNVRPDLTYFDSIIPCGMEGLIVTSMSRELGRQVDITELHGPVVDALARSLGLPMRWPGDAERDALLASLLDRTGSPAS